MLYKSELKKLHIKNFIKKKKGLISPKMFWIKVKEDLNSPAGEVLLPLHYYRFANSFLSILSAHIWGRCEQRKEQLPNHQECNGNKQQQD